MHDIEVIEDAAAAVVALDPVRARLLADLAERASAGALAPGSGSPARSSTTTCAPSSSTALVELAEERTRGGITERLLRATAASYVVFPAALDENAVNPDLAPDRI